MVMERVIDGIGNSLHCLQLDRNLWYVYVKDQDSSEKLLTKGIAIQNISLTFFDTDPYSSGNHDPTVNTLKVCLCGLPLSVCYSTTVNLKLSGNSPVLTAGTWTYQKLLLNKPCCKDCKTPGHKPGD